MRPIILFLTLLICSIASAQVHTQKGIVRRITSPEHPEQIPVSGVKVIINGVATKPTTYKGEFTVNVPDTFRVEGIEPSRYIMISPQKDKDLTYQDKPLEIIIIPREAHMSRFREFFYYLSRSYDKRCDSLSDVRRQLEQTMEQLDGASKEYVRLANQRDSIQTILECYYDEDKKATFQAYLKRKADNLALTDYNSLDEYEKKIYNGTKDGNWDYLDQIFRQEIQGDAKTYLNGLKEIRETDPDAYEYGMAVFEHGLRANFMRQNFKIVSYLLKLLTEADTLNFNNFVRAGEFEGVFRANFNQARKYYLHAIAIAENPLQKGHAYTSLGDLYCANTGMVEGVKYYRKAEAQHALLPDDDPDRIYHLVGDKRKIAFALMDMNNFREGEKVMDEWLALLSKDYDAYLQSLMFRNDTPHHDDVQRIASNFQMVVLMMLKQNRLAAIKNLQTTPDTKPEITPEQIQEMMTKYEESLLECIARCKNPHEKIAVPYLYDALASYCHLTEQPEKARDYYLKTLEVEQELYFPDHPNIGDTFANLADVCFDFEDYAAAFEAYGNAYKIYRDFWGDYHQKTIESGDNYFQTYNFLYNTFSRWEKTMYSLEQRAYLEKTFPDELADPSPNDRSLQYACCLYDLYEPAKALAFLKPSEDESNLFVTTLCFARLGRYDLTANFIGHCLKNCPYIDLVWENSSALVLGAEESGRFDYAKKIFDELDFYEYDWRSIPIKWVEYGHTKLMEGDLDAAEESYAKALELYKEENANKEEGEALTEEEVKLKVDASIDKDIQVFKWLGVGNEDMISLFKEKRGIVPRQFYTSGSDIADIQTTYDMIKRLAGTWATPDSTVVLTFRDNRALFQNQHYENGLEIDRFLTTYRCAEKDGHLYIEKYERDTSTITTGEIMKLTDNDLEILVIDKGNYKIPGIMGDHDNKEAAGVMDIYRRIQ